MKWSQRTRGTDRLQAAYRRLTERQLRTALAHAAAYPEEIEARLAFVALSVQSFERDAPYAGALRLTSSLPGDGFASIAHALAECDRLHPDGLATYVVDFLQPARA